MDERFYNKHIRFLLAPVAEQSADLFLSARCPDGSHQLLVGDFPGDAERAEVYVKLVSELFYNLSGKGMSGTAILTELNTRLYDLLPTRYFLALCFVEIDPSGRSLSILNAGLPAPILFRGTLPFAEYESQFIPLGIDAELNFTEGETVTFCEVGDRLVVYTDGAIEAQNEAGEMFGSERFRQLFIDIINNGQPLDAVLEVLSSFQHDNEQLDDIALVEIQL